MRQYLVTASEMKRYDANTIEKFHMPPLLLMERAALVTVDELQRVYGNRPCRVLVAAGCGNNGGDGLAVGRLLMLQGYEVRCALIGNEDKCTEETAQQLRILREYGVPIDGTIQDREYDIVIDALFGVGLSRPVEGAFSDAVEWIDAADAFVCSVDIASGISADTGAVMGCAVRADLTVTYGFCKLGHILYPGADHTGRLVCRQMGIDEHSFLGQPPYWYTHIGTDSRVLAARRADGNKGTFGKALVIAGSRRIAGAALMAAKSVFRVGAGMVKVVTAQENKDALAQYVPEAMTLTYREDMCGNAASDPVPACVSDPAFQNDLAEAEKWADCILIGPGIGTGPCAQALMRFALFESGLPIVIDADGLNLTAADEAFSQAVRGCGERGRTVILTPHLGEFARLYGCSTAQAKENYPEYAAELAGRLNCVVVCKDARTVVVRCKAAQGYMNTTGNSGMATAGSGDVLAGMIAGLLAQGMSGEDAASAGVYLHGTAGDLAAAGESDVSMTAADIIDHIKDAVRLQRGDVLEEEKGCMGGSEEKEGALCGRITKESVRW